MKKFCLVQCVALILIAVTSLTVKAQNVSTVRETGYIQNRGQWESDVHYYVPSAGMRIWVTDNALVYDVQGETVKTGRLVREPSKFRSMNNELVEETVVRRHVVRMEIEGGYLLNSQPSQAREGTYNYFYGKDESKWVRGVAKYGEVRFADVYKGIDMLLTTVKGAPRYDFVVKPGASPEQIMLNIKGADALSMRNDGSLRIHTSCGDIVNGNVFAYQMVGSTKQAVACAMVADGNRVSFRLGAYDKQKPLVIDPTVFCTYVGGDELDAVNGVARYKQTGEVVAVGYTASTNFPKTPGAYTWANKGAEDVFIVKYNDRLNSLKFATYFGGSNSDKAWDVAVLNDDVNRFIYVTGQTESNADFPTTTGVLSRINNGGVDAFVLKLSNDGATLRYSTFWGGAAEDIAYSITVDATGIAYFCGETASNNLPNLNMVKTGCFRTSSYGSGDGFIASLTPAGVLSYGTYWGGAKRDRCLALGAASTNDNQIFATGETISSDIPLYPQDRQGGGPNPPLVPNPAQKNLNGIGSGTASDAFIVKLNDNATALTFSTYCGANGNDIGYTIFVDNAGVAMIGGSTESTNLPQIRSIQPKKAAIDCFLAEINATGRAFTYITPWGGYGNDIIYDMDFDGNAFQIVGSTTSSDLPVSTDAGQSALSAQGDGFIAKIAYEQLGYVSYFGGLQKDEIHSITAADQMNSYFGGFSSSSTLPVSDSAVQGDYLGKQDGFVTKYTFSSLVVSTPTSNDKVCAGSTTNISWYTSNFVNTDPFMIEYTSDNGVTWKTIRTDIKARNFIWNTPLDLPASNQYRIRVTHQSTGYAILNPSAFTIRRPPAITEQSKDTSICAGGSVTLTVAATGDDLKYQWLKNSQPIAGATTASYTISNGSAADAANYELSVSGICSPAKQSAVIRVTINPGPVITQEPTELTVARGKQATFSVKADGKNLTYKWQKDQSFIAGATDAQYSIPNSQKQDEGKYRVIISGDCGADTSVEVSLLIDLNSVEYEQSADGALRIVSLSPNPADAEASLKVESLVSELRISIINALGQTVYTTTVNNSGAILLPTRQIEQGAYKLLVEAGGRQVIKNFVIVR